MLTRLSRLLRDKTRPTLRKRAGHGAGNISSKILPILTPSAFRFQLKGKDRILTYHSQWGHALFTLTLPDKSSVCIMVSGRDRWALECLIAAGDKGCTPIDTPGPRWSGYVHNLRKMGVDIETITEPHGGPFKGTHARYVLRSDVRRQTKGAIA